MAAGHKTQKMGRQSSDDHNCQIWFTSLQWLCTKSSLTIFPFGNQTKSQINIILAIFKSPYQSNILTKLGTNHINGLEELYFESVKGWTSAQTSAQTDDGQKVINIAHPEHSSGELKNITNLLSAEE